MIGASISADLAGHVITDEVTTANSPETNAVVFEKHVTLAEASVTTTTAQDADPDNPNSFGIVPIGGEFIQLDSANEPILKALAAAS